ncbi:MFS transporter [Paraburkholderia susongensis]|uniref:Sugar phosphate permease n=1 Tax=Paraburkholderia susongensis TaxID=1515439 RepID=A0A1X7M345_9BURK|nr:MFS transporter [Paraburkholderia susongensis]SMG59922.1 Sugar phosphate permease [Paraburkholderia susongensis]
MTMTASPVLDSAIAKARARLLPFLILMYVLAFIDRANVGFAKNVLQADTGLSDAAFAFGAGIFFVGYAVFEVPSNLLMYRFGARVWMSRIMVTWGIVSACTALVHDATSFYVLRTLLGIAEAGFFPGIILFLSNWFPAKTRSQTMGMFYFGFPLALLLGSPVSGLLLDAGNPFGMHPWQWLFIVEGIAASVVGVVAYFYLTDWPAQANWLDAAQREALDDALRHEDRQKLAHGPASVLAALGDARVLFCAVIYFAVQMSVYGVVFYLPTRIAGLASGGHVGVEVGLLTAIPWIAAIAGTFCITRIADHHGHHRTWAAAMLTLAALGIGASALTSSVVLAIAAFCIAAIGFVCVQPLFWTLPTGYLGGAAAAGGIALINSIGNLGGFVAPNLKGLAEHFTGWPQAGMFSLAVVGLIGALLLLMFRFEPRVSVSASASTSTSHGTGGLGERTGH